VIGRRDAVDGDPTFGDTWVYESLVGGIPGLHLSARAAVGLQFALFEALVVGLAAVYGLPPSAVVAGTVAVAVAAAGSVAMLAIGTGARELHLPAAHRRLLFGSGVETLFGVLGFAAVVTYLLTVPAAPFESLLGGRPPAPVTFVSLLILWDLCYRSGTSWWTAMVSLWRSLRYRVSPDAARRCRRLDAANAGFALLELALIPFLTGFPILVWVVLGHVAAVVVVSVSAALLIGTDA